MFILPHSSHVHLLTILPLTTLCVYSSSQRPIYLSAIKNSISKMREWCVLTNKWNSWEQKILISPLAHLIFLHNSFFKWHEGSGWRLVHLSVFPDKKIGRKVPLFFRCFPCRLLWILLESCGKKINNRYTARYKDLQQYVWSSIK